MLSAESFQLPVQVYRFTVKEVTSLDTSNSLERDTKGYQDHHLGKIIQVTGNRFYVQLHHTGYVDTGWELLSLQQSL